MKTFSLTQVFLLLILCSATAKAGWYECYNFRGTIGGEPITLSIQLVNSYLDSHKKSFTVSGIYKRDKVNEPVKLTGELDLNYKKAILYESSATSKHAASFEFDFSLVASEGVWRDLASDRAMPVHLDYVSKLRDFVDGDSAQKVEILQSDSFKDLYFVGIYSMKAGDDRVQMDKLKIIRKKDGTQLQVIELSKLAYTSGNIITIIYDNVQVFDRKTRELLLWNNTGRMGGTTSITFDRKTRRFRLHPKSHVEGPN
jgi:hypothetical protein